MSDRQDSARDDALVRYLLDELDAADAERFDELSVVDDEFAARLRTVEDDLVDAYASGNLTGERRARFEAVYLASPRRREKVAFAVRLLQAVGGTPADGGSGEKVESTERARTGSAWLPAALATAAVLCVAMLALLMRDARLRTSLREADRRATASEQRVESLAGQLAAEQKANAGSAAELARAKTARAEPAFALVLLPQTRSVGPVPVVAVHDGAKMLPLALRIDSPPRSQFDASLRDPATNRAIWRGPAAPAAEVSDASPIITIEIPAALLKSQHYVVDVFAPDPGRGSHFAGSYAFEVVRR